MANKPSFIVTPISSGAQLATADASRTAPTTYGTIFDGSTEGGFCERINIMPTGTTAAGTVRFFKKNGANFYPLFEIAIPARTASTTTAAPLVALSAEDISRPDLMPINVPSNWSIVASLSVNNPIFVAAEGGRY